MLKAPELPNLYFVKSGNYTYARMYRNAWQDKKSGSGGSFIEKDPAICNKGSVDIFLGSFNFQTVNP